MDTEEKPTARLTINLFDLSPQQVRELAENEDDPLAFGVSGALCDIYGGGNVGGSKLTILRPLTELEEDAYGPGGPMSGKPKPSFIEEPATNPCKCIDCGGTEPAHSPDCTYMNAEFGEDIATWREDSKAVTIHDNDEVRQSIAEILEDIEKNGMPNPRDLDVALDAILTGIEARFILIPRPA